MTSSLPAIIHELRRRSKPNNRRFHGLHLASRDICTIFAYSEAHQFYSVYCATYYSMIDPSLKGYLKHALTNKPDGGV